MSGRGRYRGNRNRDHGHGQQSLSSVAKEAAASLPADSPVLAMFKAAAAKLNDRHDRHERLVKLSRDITIESKRIIFLLHSAIRKEDQEKAIIEAEDRLNKLIKGPIKTIGLELEYRPAYLHSRAVSPGFQEFIEAYTLFYLLKTKDMVTWSEVQKQLEYTITEKPENESEEPKERQVVTLLTQNDFMLGIADLTGELMRRAINSISSGESDECFHSCQVVRDLYTGYLGIHNYDKELARKLHTTRTNVHKVESAVYALRVRGGEAPAPLLLGAPAPREPDWGGDGAGAASDDEGFY